jgi:acyl-CoA reductase-like NAD-dependent aldehyde dehydrogenase
MEFSVTSPIDGSCYATYNYHSWTDAETMLADAIHAQRSWSRHSVEERVQILSRWVEIVENDSERLAQELTFQMGRPLTESPREIQEFTRRSRTVLALTPEASARYDERTKGQLHQYVDPEPLGVVLVRAAWNYPYIIASHSVVPALSTGNCVLLRYSNQTPRCGERLEAAFIEAGGPPHVLQAVRLDRTTLDRLVAHPEVAQVVVTGVLPSSETKPLHRRRRHVGRGLDLGGKDPAYVRHDADLELAARTLVEAAYRNAGQSCCGVERIYVEKHVFDPFVEAFKSQVEALKLGDPREPDTTLGPMVRFQAARALHDQVTATIRQGATALLPHTQPDRAYCRPQILVDVNHSMRLMSEETFGPATGIMSVDDDDKAIVLMNQTRYALGTSVWTADVEKGLEIVKQLRTLTSSVNHCDYLDPAIAFLGVNGAPRGFTLSHFGFKMLTLSRSYWVQR